MRHLRAILALRAIALWVLMLHVVVPAAHAVLEGHDHRLAGAFAVDLAPRNDRHAERPAHRSQGDETPGVPDHRCTLCQAMSGIAPLLLASAPDMPAIDAPGTPMSPPRHVRTCSAEPARAFEARGPPGARHA